MTAAGVATPPPFGRKILPNKSHFWPFLRAATPPPFRTEWWTKVVMRGCDPPALSKFLDPSMLVLPDPWILMFFVIQCLSFIRNWHPSNSNMLLIPSRYSFHVSPTANESCIAFFCLIQFKLKNEAFATGFHLQCATSTKPDVDQRGS